MLNQKDNDFDDLFRRASERYPLRTDSADWDKMSGALDNPPTDLSDQVLDTDRRRKRRFLWLFLLFPLAGAGYYIFHPAGSGHGHAVVTAQPAKGSASGSGSAVPKSGDGGANAGTAGAGSSGAGSVGAGATGAGATGAGTAGSGSASAGAVTDRASTGGGASAGTSDGRVAGAGSSHTGAAGTGTSGGSAATAGTSNGGAAGGAGASGKNGGVGNGSARVGSEKKGGVGNGRTKIGGGENSVTASRGRSDRGNRGSGDVIAIVSGRKKKKNSGSVSTPAGDNFDAVDIAANGNDKMNHNSNGGASGRVADYPVNRVRMRGDYSLTVNVEAPVTQKDKDSSKTKPKTSSKQKFSYVYAGLLAAPDLSTVKFQSTKGVGTTYSLLLGYQFNKKWAVETGVSVDRKRYYTDAEYFDTKGIPSGALNPAWDVKSYDGTCYMWEIPINVRYNFSQSEKSKWFATAGLSTYLMTREKYNYNYTVAGTWDYTKTWNWPTHDNYWFSIINLSAGYEHRLGGIGNLRIEPYLRIPLAGVGTGKLNILSAGLNIGITRRLW